MADPISVCLNDLRSATDIASVEPVLKTFFSSCGIDSYLYHDPCAPLAGNCLAQSSDHSLTLNFERQEMWRLDPLRLRDRVEPLVWRAGSEPDSPSSDASRLVWSPVSKAGYRQAVLVPVYGPTGRCTVLNVLMREPPCRAHESDRLINDLVLLTYDLSRIFRNSAAARCRSELTRRENDCLRWTTEGKTAWEIGQILGISERTAHFHLQNAMRKLDSRTKHQAAIAAMRLGLLSSAEPNPTH